MFHMEANWRISPGFFARLTIMNWPWASILAHRAFRDAAMNASSSTRPSYFSWSLRNTPMIFEEFCASRMPAMLGMYWRSSSSACTRRTVSPETLPVFP